MVTAGSTTVSGRPDFTEASQRLTALDVVCDAYFASHCRYSIHPPKILKSPQHAVQPQAVWPKMGLRISVEYESLPNTFSYCIFGVRELTCLVTVDLLKYLKGLKKSGIQK